MSDLKKYRVRPDAKGIKAPVYERKGEGKRLHRLGFKKYGPGEEVELTAKQAVAFADQIEPLGAQRAGPARIADLNMADLKGLAQRAGIFDDIEGTGAGGRILKQDLVAALTDDEDEEEGEGEDEELDED